MTSEPRVAIGMPVYNGADYVGEAIRSLLAQTETGFELLVSDDGSTDETADLVASLAQEDPRITLVRQSDHLGMTANFRFVREHTHAPLFMWAAQDDRWHPEFLATGLGHLSRHPEALGFLPAVEFVSASGEALATATPAAGLSDEDPATRARAVRDRGYLGIYALFRREAISGTVQPEDVAAPDAAFMFGIALAGQLTLSSRPLCVRREMGYELVAGPDGNPVPEKSLGSSGHLYAGGSRATAELMLGYVRRSSLGTLSKARLSLHVVRAWWWRRWRRQAIKGSAWRTREAWSEHRYLAAFGLGIRHALLDPASLVRAFSRSGGERP